MELSMSGFISSIVIRIIPHAVSAAFLLGIAVAVMMSGSNRREVRIFSAIAGLEASWMGASLLEIASSSIDWKLAWDAAQWPLVMAIAAAYTAFTYTYVRGSAKGPRPAMLAGLCIPVLVAVAAAASAVTGFETLLYASVDRLPGLPFAALGHSASPLAVVLGVYGILLSALAILAMGRYFASKTAERRKGSMIIAIGLVIPLLGAGIDAIGIGIQGLDEPMALWFPVGALCCVYGLFSQRLFGSVTVARRAVMDTLMDPVFVLDKADEVVDCNAAARTLLGVGNPVGESARQLFAAWPSAVNAALGFPEAETEVDLPDHDGILRRSYRITVASNSAKDKTADWKLLVFSDMTGQKSDTRNLAASNEELEFWVRQRTTALRQEVAQRTVAEERLIELNDEMAKTQREILWTLSEVVESRSRETAYHVVRVGEYAKILSRAYGLSAEEVEIITTAAPMHDVGKIAIPDAILSKPGLLTAEEREVMKHHTVVGREILGSSDRPLLRAASVIAFEHHERWDGKGYPLGKAGLEISLSGRIVSLCDVFDALYNKRVYKDAWPLEKVLDLFRAESGAAFEPRLVDILFECLDDILEISRKFADEAELATL
ncbi:MAG: hypothetical protein CVV51_03625 [Spirochaetae bacterium HGW-Spirochaetae-7]|jgi:HD-GYP domain-containing protein (c-di-GMP phosphodiesterase class II)|nr:MAG: hypothetical protein CVV51_03625 [Spirochaetae bacterium HGW-Spirochaetae-7]